ncbi:dTDP-4-dehydrorhamnose 3,5-epimerase family protein [Lentisalinibacter orientalis]|uniref:dTDP-4-dehydrorhamnose 3,5-epimerase family protein n=1 Tax=Lentisalinibacter orientalis TaxID=2992241 RepID=UPI00386602AA
MRFVETELVGAWVLEPDKKADERGYFTRLRCAREFAERGLPREFVQTNLSYNRAAGTFRGLHYQLPPSREGKLVRCIRGAIDDIIVDLRPGSRSFLRHQWFRLDAEGLKALFVPAGFAHGFRTLEDGSEVLYEMSDYYAPDLACGIRWDDPALGITMPGEVVCINPRDAAYPDLDTAGLAVFDER